MKGEQRRKGRLARFSLPRFASSLLAIADIQGGRTRTDGRTSVGGRRRRKASRVIMSQLHFIALLAYA